MNRQTTCNKCGYDFTIEKSCCGTVEVGDLSVQYFFCPKCKAKYQILTADSRMRELIAERQALQREISTAQKQKFREKSIRELLGRFDRIVAEQKRLAPELKKRGEDILMKGAAVNEKEEN